MLLPFAIEPAGSNGPAKTKARYRLLPAGVRIRVELCKSFDTRWCANHLRLLERMRETMIEVIIFM